jgi:hypothetical protein
MVGEILGEILWGDVPSSMSPVASSPSAASLSRLEMLEISLGWFLVGFPHGWDHVIMFFGKRRLVGTMFLDHFFLRWRKAAWDILHPKSRIHHSPFIHKSFCREKRMILPRLTFPDLVKGKVCTNPWSTLLCYGFRS